jgi:hypothetical protein
MQPTGPCFVVGPRGYFRFEPSFISIRQQARLLAVVNGFFAESTAFDRDGQKWRSTGLQSPYQKSWWTTLLANTVYNPRISVTLLWSEPERYSMDELKRAYLRAVDQDDDILTQFVGPTDLKSRISAACSFDELVEVYRWMETDENDATDA